MKVWILGSGSQGNALVLECDGARVLVDVGFGPRTLARRLRIAGVRPESIDSVLLTHEHGDHLSGAAAAARRWGWTVYATRGTRAHAPSLADVPVRLLHPGTPLDLGALEVLPLRVPHDGVEPVGFVATARRSGARVGIVYDLGHVPERLFGALGDLDMLVLESNHDEGMLRAGPYPPVVRHRIGSAVGHIGNRAAVEAARRSAHAGLSWVVLAHLSEHCNTPQAALGAMTRGLRPLRGARWRGRVQVALQDDVTGPLEPGQAGTRGQQLSLGL